VISQKCVQISANADDYDTYIRDSVRPWSLQFDKVLHLEDGAGAVE
jgi:hypothetical protein